MSTTAPAPTTGTPGATPGFDETYHLNMRAYTLYVLSHATATDGTMRSEGTNLVGQSPRLSTHARAWLALALGKMGMTAESKTTLDSLAASAKQSSTTAHWEEDRPDYWSLGTQWIWAQRAGGSLPDGASSFE